MGMGLATTFVMTMASICAWLIDTDPDPAGHALPAHLVFYSGHCGGGAIYRNGSA